MAGKVKVYDAGGSTWAYQAVKNGDLAATKTYVPYTELKADRGIDVRRLERQDAGPVHPLPSIFVTKANIAEHQAEY